MSQVCSKCSHVNPPEASYCYYDGAVLGGHRVNGGPVNAGSAPFPSPFVFPSGQQCRNFDQLAMACQQHWPSAVDLLRQGFLGSFLGGIGRVDLAMAAQEAARFPDIDRGLDQLLDKLPTQVLQKPRLVAEPSDINLGILAVGADRQFDLHLANQGMRLLYGSVVSDCKWLTLGEPPGNAQKLFQFGSEGSVPVQIRGQQLRAGNKPLEGHLVLESNGGQATITVRVEVPVRPFREGVLAGALSPRQIAEKAKAQPKEAAVLFERGAVADWFKENGWTYPVQGPSASGLGAVQQFFEALGLATAPKVEIAQKSLTLQGSAGQPLEAMLEVRTQEKRPVYAHATCDQPWVDVSRVALNGRVANIAVRIPAVPPRPGEVLQANIHVQANGNQRFTVPLSLTVTGTGTYPVGPPVLSPAAVEPVYAQPAYAQPVFAQPAYAQPVAVQPIPVQAVPVQALPVEPVPAQPVNPFAFADAVPVMPAVPVEAAVPYVTAQPVQAIPVGVTAAPPYAAPHVPVGAAPRPPRAEGQAPAWVHLAPAGLLLLILIGLIIRDLIAGSGPLSIDGIPIDPRPRVQAFFADGGVDKERNEPMPPYMQFGVVALDPSHPKEAYTKLTYSLYGRTNTTVVRIDNNDRAFGIRDGRWEKQADRPGGKGKTPALRSTTKWGGQKSECVWMFDDGIQVTQIVEVVPGEPVETRDGFRRLLDTVLVRYQLENKDNKSHQVGLRFMLDTLIGMKADGITPNDGVPFTVPGLTGLVDRLADFAPPTPVPDFVQVLEKADLKKPGLIALLNFKVGSKVEAPTRVSLTRWPGVSLLWEIPLVPMAEDSAVAMYWNPRELKAGEKREVGFSYGLGSVSSASGRLGLSVGGEFTPGGELSVVALVSDPQKGEKVKLILPEGFRLVEGQKDSQEVPLAQVPGRPVPVTWHVLSSATGNFNLEVQLQPNGISQKKRVQIKTESIF
jgi:hypothetical protein